ncbi:MAG TPA: CIA30 family protein, partial [Roseovarius sp.]|nr:CIA30 family protein [Roseovarius sp.]
TGTVSTANRGGFIQARVDLDTALPEDAQGVVLRVRGTGGRYFVHLRTRGTVLPWQYYQAGFEVTSDWQDLRVPFTAFVPSGALLRDTPDPTTITSLAAVAYGRDHQADLSFRWVGVY